MADQVTREFPADWTEWNRMWGAWRDTYALTPSGATFGKKNMMADDVLGIYSVGGAAVELSEVTFPGLGTENRGQTFRYVGITWKLANGQRVNGGLVESFTELESALAAGPPEGD